jgi:hypothetical protein
VKQTADTRAARDQAFNLVYITQEYPNKGDLSVVRAVERVASMWAEDAEEAIALFRSKPPAGVRVHRIKAVVPGQMDRANWIEFSDEERRRVAGASSLEI